MIVGPSVVVCKVAADRANDDQCRDACISAYRIENRELHPQ